MELPVQGLELIADRIHGIRVIPPSCQGCSTQSSSHPPLPQGCQIEYWGLGLWLLSNVGQDAAVHVQDVAIDEIRCF